MSHINYNSLYCTQFFLFLQLAIANPRWEVMNKLKVAKFVDELGNRWIFLSVGDAVDACLNAKMGDLSTINC